MTTENPKNQMPEQEEDLKISFDQASSIPNPTGWSPKGYSRQEEYEEKIEPLVKQLRELCMKEKFPVVISVSFENTNPDGNGKGRSGIATSLIGIEIEEGCGYGWLPDEFKVIHSILEKDINYEDVKMASVAGKIIGLFNSK